MPLLTRGREAGCALRRLVLANRALCVTEHEPPETLTYRENIALCQRFGGYRIGG